MPLDPDAAVTQVKELLPGWKANFEKLSQLDRWHRNKLNTEDLPSAPRQVTKEYKELLEMAQTPWAKLLVDLITRFLAVDGFSDDKGDDLPGWKIWQANRLDGRQGAFYESASALGLAYASVLPGTDPITEEPMPVVRGLSARRTYVVYEDPANDEWPTFALTGEAFKKGDDKAIRYRLYDADAIHTVEIINDSVDSATHTGGEVHAVSVCPVVRFAPHLDIEGRTTGEVEPVVGMIRRLNQTTFDRLVVQRFGAWVVRWATGLSTPTPQEGQTEFEVRQAAKIRLSIEDILISEGEETKFGTLSGTPMGPYIEAAVHDGRAFASITAAPPHALLGELVNISAEALAAAEAGHNRHVAADQLAYGEAHEQMFRLGAWINGDRKAATNPSGQVRWRDTESRSLAQVADALLKISQLGAPTGMLLEKIPGWTQQDVQRAKDLAENADPFAGLAAQLNGAAEGDSEVADLKARFDALGVAIRSGVSPESAAASLGLKGLTFTGAVPVSLRVPEEEAARLEAAV